MDFRKRFSSFRNLLRLSLAVLPLTLVPVTIVLATALTPLHSSAQASQATTVKDASALHPPAGASVAIVEFSDLECPACASANPILMQAAAQYKIPWVRHDFIIPGHPWSPVAAVNARWFDAKGNGLGDAYRNAIFASQSSIYNVNVLADFTQKFAQSHGVALPFSIDPQGKLAALVQADTDMGTRTGIHLTPTIFIVTAHSKGAPYIQVQNAQTDLYRTIDQAIADTKQAAAATHSAAHK
jgi:protein-disulfide isomerase